MFAPSHYFRSTSLQDGTIFEDVIVFLTSYDENGATGFVINKPFGRKLNELDEFSDSIGFPLNDGGPVNQEGIYFIHRRPDLITGGNRVANGIYFGGDFKTAVALLNDGTITSADIKMFIGYCGWDAGDLESETEGGNWEPISLSNPF